MKKIERESPKNCRERCRGAQDGDMLDAVWGRGAGNEGED